jgi:hypothetical protein
LLSSSNDVITSLALALDKPASESKSASVFFSAGDLFKSADELGLAIVTYEKKLVVANFDLPLTLLSRCCFCFIVACSQAFLRELIAARDKAAREADYCKLSLVDSCASCFALPNPAALTLLLLLAVLLLCRRRQGERAQGRSRQVFWVRLALAASPRESPRLRSSFSALRFAPSSVHSSEKPADREKLESNQKKLSDMEQQYQVRPGISFVRCPSPLTSAARSAAVADVRMQISHAAAEDGINGVLEQKAVTVCLVFVRPDPYVCSLAVICLLVLLLSQMFEFQVRGGR